MFLGPNKNLILFNIQARLTQATNWIVEIQFKRSPIFCNFTTKNIIWGNHFIWFEQLQPTISLCDKFVKAPVQENETSFLSFVREANESTCKTLTSKKFFRFHVSGLTVEGMVQKNKTRKRSRSGKIKKNSIFGDL